MRIYLGLCTILLLTLASCRIGNDLNGSCQRGEECVCDLIGNCSRSCPAGGCDFECRGTGNCIFTCEGGGCETLCKNTGNCITECPGGSCSTVCQGTGTCLVRGDEDLAVKAPDLQSIDLSSHD